MRHISFVIFGTADAKVWQSLPDALIDNAYDAGDWSITLEVQMFIDPNDGEFVAMGTQISRATWENASEVDLGSHATQMSAVKSFFNQHGLPAPKLCHVVVEELGC